MDSPVAPSWLVLPLAMIALLVVASHLLVLREHAIGKMPESRRQIRMLTGWVMMVAIPLTAYGFGIARPSDTETFSAVWLGIIGILGAIIMMACIDALNNMRIAQAQRKELRDELRRIMTETPESKAPDLRLSTSEHDG